MFKIVLVVLSVLLMIGMFALDFFISRDTNRPAKKKDEIEVDKHEKD